jgi:hypothetical protein
MKKWIFAIASVTIIVTVLGVYKWANQPVSNNLDPTVVSEVKGITSKGAFIDNRLFSADLPVGFRLSEQNERKSSSQILQIVAITSTSPANQVAFTIGYKEGGFDVIPDYVYRASNTDIYKLISMPDSSVNRQYFEKNDHTELTVFINNQTYYAIISLSGTANTANFIEIISSIIQSWTWKLK